MPRPKVKKGKWEKERERTKSGAWRRKRSDTGKKKERVLEFLIKGFR